MMYWQHGQNMQSHTLVMWPHGDPESLMRRASCWVSTEHAVTHFGDVATWESGIFDEAGILLGKYRTCTHTLW